MAEVFLDTNVLVYAFDTSDEAKRTRAFAVLTDHPDAVISTQVLLEWFTIVTRKLTPTLPLADAVTAMGVLARLDVVPADADLALRAARTSVEAQLSIWDAMVIEAAAIAGCGTILTEDLNDGQVIRGVKVINPFAD
ncbi:MAG: PIN domain-containing protein [Tessaracoccus sp.]|uniref:PIN domain-containing protein n=1 Tax=Tessaracoccus sp. TaxID=1971211 RepID=UPI001ECEE45C|nr:PIN domain-containing protein [Tessaracoccus sp.]MBK7820589.1 PIN domain-containing protein [Tessaracoccus sp.]